MVNFVYVVGDRETGRPCHRPRLRHPGPARAAGRRRHAPDRCARHPLPPRPRGRRPDGPRDPGGARAARGDAVPDPRPGRRGPVGHAARPGCRPTDLVEHRSGDRGDGGGDPHRVDPHAGPHAGLAVLPGRQPPGRGRHPLPRRVRPHRPPRWRSPAALREPRPQKLAKVPDDAMLFPATCTRPTRRPRWARPAVGTSCSDPKTEQEWLAMFGRSGRPGAGRRRCGVGRGPPDPHRCGGEGRATYGARCAVRSMQKGKGEAASFLSVGLHAPSTPPRPGEGDMETDDVTAVALPPTPEDVQRALRAHSSEFLLAVSADGEVISSSHDSVLGYTLEPVGQPRRGVPAPRRPPQPVRGRRPRPDHRGYRDRLRIRARHADGTWRMLDVAIFQVMEPSDAALAGRRCCGCATSPTRRCGSTPSPMRAWTGSCLWPRRCRWASCRPTPAGWVVFCNEAAQHIFNTPTEHLTATDGNAWCTPTTAPR